MAGKPRTVKPRTEKPKAEKPKAETSEGPSFIPVSWQQPSEVGMNFGTYLQIEKYAAPKTPRGSAGEATANAVRVKGNGPQAKSSFRRGRIWA